MHKKSQFEADSTQPARTGVDRLGRTWVDETGTLHSTRQGSMQMRRITLHRDGQPPLVVITDLLDADHYPANDLLELYRQRWGIEQVFQQVSEVFHLTRLIGSSPEAIIFQGAFCMILYNLLLVIRAILADTQERAISSISTFNLCYDLKRELTVLHHLLKPDEILQSLRAQAVSIVDLRVHLKETLTKAWTERWVKSPPKKRHPKPVKHKKGAAGHFSIHRARLEHKKAEDV
jgi:hypothetical protein